MTYVLDHPDDVIDDDELTRLALEAGEIDDVADDAVPLVSFDGDDDALLPSWYMPSPMQGRKALRGWRRNAVVIVIAAFLMIDCYGLCDTYGDLHVGALTTHSQVHHSAPAGARSH
jgi:hypothetical protein